MSGARRSFTFGMITIREAVAADSEFAYQVRNTAFRPYVERVEPWDDRNQRQLHDRRFRSQEFRIITAAGTDAGFMALSHEPDCLHVYQLHLLPEYQGKGIGELAMQALLADADRLHVPIRLRVMKVNPRARSFYERLGFTLVGDTETHDLMERVPVGAVTM